MFTITSIGRTNTGWLKITVAEHPHVIIRRSPGQARNDVEESGIIEAAKYDSMPNFSFNKLKVKYIGGQLSGNINFVKAGSLYELTEHSKLLQKDEDGNLPKNPATGKVYKVGDTAVRKNDSLHIEGFLTLTMNGQAALTDAIASNAVSNLLGAFGGVAINAPTPIAKLEPIAETSDVDDI